jgi:hypothetical protein
MRDCAVYIGVKGVMCWMTCNIILDAWPVKTLEAVSSLDSACTDNRHNVITFRDFEISEFPLTPRH